VVDAPWGEEIACLWVKCYFGHKDYQKSIESLDLDIKLHGENSIDVYSLLISLTL
jgi:hypothetical protein